MIDIQLCYDCFKTVIVIVIALNKNEFTVELFLKKPIFFDTAFLPILAESDWGKQISLWKAIQ